MSEDQKFVVTTTEIIVRQQEVWATTLAEAAEYVQNILGDEDGEVVNRKFDVLRVEADRVFGLEVAE